MNRSHHVGKAGIRARSSKAASIRQSLLENDDFDEVIEAPAMHALPDDENDWPELENDAVDVETEIELHLKGASYR